MFMVKIQEDHGSAAFALQGIIPEGMKNSSPPLIETAIKTMFLARDSVMKMIVYLPIPGIEPTIPDHLKVLFRDMPDQAFYEFHDGNGFFDVDIILVSVVMERDKIAIVFINARSSYDWPAEITTDIFGYDLWVTLIGLGVDIKPVFMISIAGCLNFFKRRTEYLFHLI